MLAFEKGADTYAHVKEKHSGMYDPGYGDDNLSERLSFCGTCEYS